MQATAAEIATGGTRNGTTNGLQDSEPRVVDVTAELIGERREEWRDGVEYGIRQGTQRVLQSGALGQLALELKLLRALHDSHCEAAEQRERLLAHWKAEARWWREEHAALQDEFAAFVKEIARKCGV